MIPPTTPPTTPPTIRPTIWIDRVLVHGFTGHPDTWDAALGESGGASVLRLAPLGHEGAPLEADPVAEGSAGFAAEVDRLAAQIRAAGPVAAGGAHLIGYSLGARLALGLLCRHGALFRGATLIGVNPGLDDAAERAARQAEDEQRAERLESGGPEGLDRFLLEWEAQPLFASLRRVPAEARAALAALRRRHTARGLALCLRRLGLGVMPSYWSALGRIPQPVRLVVGAEDPKFVHIAARALPRLGRGSLVVVADAGHNVPLEQPLALRPFLAARLAGGGAAAPASPPSQPNRGTP